MTTMEATAVSIGKPSNYQVIRRLLTFMMPFNLIMFISLTARAIKFIGQAAVLGIAASSIGIYMEGYDPSITMTVSAMWENMPWADPDANWAIIWGQVAWVAFAGSIVGITSYIENYTGHYVAFRILAETDSYGSG